ncbi:MAG: outer membrane lipoprotein-sorting protein [Oligoflexales bacterium]|nr:outer membrane lipoprotein-sorting protein [Oligoflexales bacterium]
MAKMANFSAVKNFISIPFFILIASGMSFSEEKPTAKDLLKDSDRARGTAKEGITWGVILESFDDGTHNKVNYKVKVKGDNAIAEAIAPPRNKGDTILFNDRNMWFFKIVNKKPVANSARQKLMGQAANGEIAPTKYYRDYDGQIVGEEKVEGQDAWKLELKAKAKNVTYDGIRYWISKKDRLGIKAEFLTLSGEVFKRAAFEYKNKMKTDNGSYLFVSRMEIISAINKDNKSILAYDSPKQENHPDSAFNVNNLVR